MPLTPQPAPPASAPRTSGPVRAAARRLPLAAGATAAALALFTTGCDALPDDISEVLPEGDGGAEDEQQPEEEEEPEEVGPEDAEGSIQAAADAFAEAPSYEVQDQLHHESDDPFLHRSATYRYSSEPEQLVYSRHHHDGAREILHYRSDSAHMVASGDSTFEALESPDEVQEQVTGFEVGSDRIRQILETSTDMAHEGQEEVQRTYSETDAEGYGSEVEDTVTAERYSGTFSAAVPQVADDDLVLTLNEHPEVPFTLWIGEDGLPAMLEHSAGEFDHTQTFLYIEPVDMEMPEPGDSLYG